MQPDPGARAERDVRYRFAIDPASLKASEGAAQEHDFFRSKENVDEK
ncbi:MAG: hypothetical protein ACYCSP_09400 [Acidobacteriaceae bacterium]